LAPGVSTVRYPIPQRTFKYVATVQSLTDETCQNQTLTQLPRTAVDPNTMFNSTSRGGPNESASK